MSSNRRAVTRLQFERGFTKLGFTQVGWGDSAVFTHPSLTHAIGYSIVFHWKTGEPTPDFRETLAHMRESLAASMAKEVGDVE